MRKCYAQAACTDKVKVRIAAAKQMNDAPRKQSLQKKKIQSKTQNAPRKKLSSLVFCPTPESASLCHCGPAPWQGRE